MNIFFWKKNKQIDAFAISLADEFYSHIQPQVAIDFMKSKNINDITSLNDNNWEALVRTTSLSPEAYPLFSSV